MPGNTSTAKYSIQKYAGDGSTVVWQISFAGGYISRSHVKAYTTASDGTETDITLQWTGDNTVVVYPPVPTGTILTIYRDTPKDRPLADFTDGAVVSEMNLDSNAEQPVPRRSTAPLTQATLSTRGHSLSRWVKSRRCYRPAISLNLRYWRSGRTAA